jgi:hypothetical protein
MPVHSESGVTAVVQQDDVTLRTVPFKSLGCVFLDDLRSGGPPVKAGNVPHHRFKSKLASGLQNGWTAGAEWRPKEAGLNACGVGYGLRTVGILLAHLPSGQQQKIGMSEGMVSKQMSRVGNRTSNLRTRRNKSSDQKERRLHIVSS